MASTGAETGVPTATPQICSHCRKSFPRLCDLNKHAKSHSRPFKCSFISCKYHHHGWPTAKELERHVNDKHSLAPRTYACAFASCSYESKRESNCKQHMEKKHGWEYVRSKSNGKKLPTRDTITPRATGPISKPQQFPSNAQNPPLGETLSPRSPLVHPFDSDFILYPDHAEHPIVVDQTDEELNRGFVDPEDESQVFIPWNSPATRMLKNQSVLDDFTETYNRGLEKPIGHPDAFIDPTLQHYGSDSVAGWQRIGGNRLSAIDTLVKTEPPNMGMDKFSWNGGSDTGSAPADSPSDHRNPSTAYSSQFTTPHSGAVDFTGAPAHPGQMGWNQPGSRRRGSDEQDQRPEKKLKSSPIEEFTDNNMPDIFRFAHPRIYDRDQKEKYSPCHSSHRDISTLVRHLGRPAHRLTVTKEAISSFDIEDDDYPHPRIGICRRCWKQFPQRQVFEQHASGPCDKVSKGKREKWQILHDSFTPLVAPTPMEVTSAHPGRYETTAREESVSSPTCQPNLFPADMEGPAWTSALPTAPPSAGGYLGSGSAAPASVLGEGLVPAHEYERLQKERNDLERRNRQLERILAEQRVARLSSAAPQDLGHSLTTGRGLGGDLQIADTSDRTNLVLHMGSQPEEVDIEGLMNEPMNEAQDNLARQDSGLSSSSRSTIHHVTTSPPQRLVEFEGDTAKGHAIETATPNRKPPASIPDSGYSSTGHHRHGSFGDVSHMPGAPHRRGHQRNTSSISSVGYAAGKPLEAGEPATMLSGPHMSWTPTLHEHTSAPAQSTVQEQPHDTFLPGQGPAPEMHEYFSSDEFLNMFDR